MLDTNVLLAAFATHGLCETILELCLTEHEAVISPPIVDELTRHLTGKFKLSAARVLDVANFVKSAFELVEPVAVANDACRDPDDLMVLGTAVAARADYIVTGDKDLLVLGEFCGIAILSHRPFYEKMMPPSPE